jgi:hypothetical protein
LKVVVHGLDFMAHPLYIHTYVHMSTYKHISLPSNTQFKTSTFRVQHLNLLVLTQRISIFIFKCSVLQNVVIKFVFNTFLSY